MSMAALWFQDADVAALASSNHWIMIFTGLIAFSMVMQAIVLAVLASKAMAAIKDVLATFDSVKLKLFPIIETSGEVIATVKSVVNETRPKIGAITDNVVKTSVSLVEVANVAKGSAQKFAQTATDANVRTQRQVARVDGMVSAALTTTTEVVEAINHGIKAPVLKLSSMITQLKQGFDGMTSKFKSKSSDAPFGNR